MFQYPGMIGYTHAILISTGGLADLTLGFSSQVFEFDNFVPVSFSHLCELYFDLYISTSRYTLYHAS